MSSTNKTENYSLNQWALNDVPKMEDFNSDNKTIDTVMFKHISDSVIHLSEEEKQAVVNPLVTVRLAETLICLLHLSRAFALCLL